MRALVRLASLNLVMLGAGVGCGTTGGEGTDGTDTAATGDLDRDGDGLTDAEEADLGTDPDAVDTDADGYSDGDEANAGTDPTDDADHPYTGGWPIDSCRDDIQGTGTFEGDIAEAWTRIDQYGEDIAVHDFCDHTVLLVGVAFW